MYIYIYMIEFCMFVLFVLPISSKISPSQRLTQESLTSKARAHLGLEATTRWERSGQPSWSQSSFLPVMLASTTRDTHLKLCRRQDFVSAAKCNAAWWMR